MRGGGGAAREQPAGESAGGGRWAARARKMAERPALRPLPGLEEVPGPAVRRSRPAGTEGADGAAAGAGSGGRVGVPGRTGRGHGARGARGQGRAGAGCEVGVNVPGPRVGVSASVPGHR